MVMAIQNQGQKQIHVKQDKLYDGPREMELLKIA